MDYIGEAAARWYTGQDGFFQTWGLNNPLSKKIQMEKLLVMTKRETLENVKNMLCCLLELIERKGF